MRRRRVRVAVGVAVVGVAALVLALMVGMMRGSGTALRANHEKLAEGANEEYAAGKNENRTPEGTAEAQEAANRAYPATADSLSFATTLNAQRAFAAIKAGANAPGQWELIGPSSATYPGVLNVLGDGDQYVASGRTIAMAVGPKCTKAECRLYIGAAGGGVWRTTKALQGANWEFVSGSFATSSIGALEIDPNDASGSTILAGTGEPNASGDSQAGMGVYRSTDGGSTWALLPGSSIFQGRAISDIVIQPNGAILVGVARAIRGYSGHTGGATSNPPVAVPFGVYRSTNGGATFTQIWDGAGSIRGVTHIELDPSAATTMYASAFQVGVYRSLNNGATWTEIKAPLNPLFNTDRPEFAVNRLPNGKTRMYVGIGASAGATPARVYRTDDAAGTATFVDVTSPQNEDYCTQQCWYDNYVVSPKGHPDVVYLGGSYDYNRIVCCGGNGSTNGRAVLLSTNAGQTWSDLTQDGDPNQAEAMHPDHHELVVNPNNPFEFWEGSDGGVIRAGDGFVDVSYKCDQRGLSVALKAYCKSLLWRVPKEIVHLNAGLNTLQFNSLSVSNQRPKNLAQGGTQDNGTFVYTGSKEVWKQEIYGDGGQSGFNVADDSLRFNTFFGQASDVNFRNGDPTKWVIATGDIVSSDEASHFYPPIIADPHAANAMTIFQGSQSVWRTQDWGGDRDYLEANCPEFTTSAANPDCGDFVKIGPAGATDLTGPAYGADRLGSCATLGTGCVARIARTASDTGTMWVSTGTGRLFITRNANAPAGSVTYTRLDTLATNDPPRFISGITIDPSNPNRAWISYSGYSAVTPATPGHIFEVNVVGATATWTNLDTGVPPLGDLPVTDIARDDATGRLYAATDFGVITSTGGAWTVAGSGLPQVEVAGLTIVPSERILYAATHGRSIWRLNLG